jgi:hypothetical protein
MSLLITAQTVKAAARLIIDTSNHPEKEIDRVTTPQGITISGLNEMEHQGLSSAVIRGLLTSYNKLESLASKSQKSGKETYLQVTRNQSLLNGTNLTNVGRRVLILPFFFTIRINSWTSWCSDGITVCFSAS